MSRMVWAEMRKLLRSPGVAIVTALGVLYMYYVNWRTSDMISRGQPAETFLAPEAALSYSLLALGVMGSLLTAVFGAVCSGQEFACHTWSLVLTQGARRRHVWSAKVIAIMAAVAGWMLAALAAGYVSSVWATGRTAWPHLSLQTAAQAGVVYFRLVFWALVAFAAASAGKGTAAGLAGGIGFPLAEALFLGELPLRSWLPTWFQVALNAAVFGTGDLGIFGFSYGPYPSARQALAIICLLTAATLVASYAAIQRYRPA